MSKTKRLAFTDDFKKEAVRLIGTSARTLPQVAKDLGVGLSSLSRWKQQSKRPKLRANRTLAIAKNRPRNSDFCDPPFSSGSNLTTRITLDPLATRGIKVLSSLSVVGFMEARYSQQTRLLDFKAAPIQNLIAARGWAVLEASDRIGKAYAFVRDEIAFGYNRADHMAASEVLKDGYGQCNTKGTLLMGLLRALGIPCRLHGFTIHKGLQRGVVPELVYGLAPESILHSWVEIWHGERWINLEGFILDRPFLRALQAEFTGKTNELCGYGAGTDCLSSPPVDWNGTDTYIQRTGINADLGIFDSPDDFYARHRQSFGWVQGIIYRHIIRHWMNVRARKIRKGQIPAIPGDPTSHEHA